MLYGVNPPLLLHCGIVSEHLLYMACLVCGLWIQLLFREWMGLGLCCMLQIFPHHLFLQPLQGNLPRSVFLVPSHHGSSTAAICLTSKRLPLALTPYFP